MNIRLFVRPPAHLAVLLVAYQACFPNIITSPKRKQRIISPLLYNNSMQTLHSLLDKHLSTQSFSGAHCLEYATLLKHWIKACVQGAALSLCIQSPTFQSNVCLHRSLQSNRFPSFQLLGITEPAQSIDLAREADGIWTSGEQRGFKT